MLLVAAREGGPLGRLLDRRFLRRALRGSFDTRELEQVWRLEEGGERVGSVVHLFPYSLFTPEGTPSARGYELRDPRGQVRLWTDGSGRFLSPRLHAKAPDGRERLSVTVHGLGTRLTVEDPMGAPVAEVLRGPPVAGLPAWRVVWVRGDLDVADEETLGRTLLLAALWRGG